MTEGDPQYGQSTADVGTPADATEVGTRAAGNGHGSGDTEPVLPDRAREDTDAAWGEYSERDDDRLYRDRPPHWDDF